MLEKMFFSFANTVATIDFAKKFKGHGWMGIKFQTDSSEEYSEIQMHVRFHLIDAKAQQEAFLAAFSNGFGNWPMQASSKEGTAGDEVNNKTEELESIKKQLSDLQEQLSKMNK